MTKAGERLISSAKEARDKMTKRYFVFLQGMREPEGQIIYGFPHSGEGQKIVKYLFGPVEIQDETLSECIEKYNDKLPSSQ